MPKKKYFINEALFIKDFTPESVYLLGFIWADGHIRYNKHHRIEIRIHKDDAFSLFPTFLKTGTWSYGERKKNVVCITVSSINVTKFLLEHRYGPHTKDNPTILSIIPQHLKHFWFRGLVDGDGSWYYNKQFWRRVLEISGPYDQSWVFLEELSKELNISRFRIERLCRSNGRVSRYTLRSRDSITKFGDFIYSTFNQDHIGLVRKFNKYITIRGSYKEK